MPPAQESNDLPLGSFDLTVAEVRSRFDRAVEQGSPQWLWPDVQVTTWRDALGQIEGLTRDVIVQGYSKAPLTGDPAAIGIAAYTSGMGPQLGLWHEQGRLEADADTGALLRLHLRHNRLRMQRMATRAVAAVEALASHGIAVCVLKGMDTAYRYFPEPGARPLSDIDLLIDPSDEIRAGEVLAAADFEQVASHACPRQQTWRRPGRSEPQALCLVHADDSWSIDLQMSLNRRFPAGAATVAIDALRSSDSAPSWTLSASATVAAQPLLLIQLACHASCGLWNTTMLRLVELAWVIRRDTATGYLHWDEFLASAERIQALGFVYPALLMSARLVPGTVPPEVLEACRQHAPAAVRRVLAKLSPGEVHRVVRCSFTEQFMWSASPFHLARQVVREALFPEASSRAARWAVHRQRARRLLNGTITVR